MAAQLLGLLFLPVFTLNYGQQYSLTKRAVKLKTFKDDGVGEQKKNDDLAKTKDEKDLYDADMDDLDSSDIGEQEKKMLKQKNSSAYFVRMQTNMKALVKAIYMLGFMVTLLFFCSSLFTYLTRRELIFQERTGPKYIFDLV